MPTEFPPGLRIVARAIVPALSLGRLDGWEAYSPGARIDIETSLALCALLVSRGERKAMRLAKIAAYCRLPRATMRRKLKRAIVAGIAVECGGEFAFATAFTESGVYQQVMHTLLTSVQIDTGEVDPGSASELRAAACAALVLRLADLLRTSGCTETVSVERWALLWVLVGCAFDEVEARPALLAARTGMSRTTLYRWLGELQAMHFLMPGDLLPPRLVIPKFHAPEILVLTDKAVAMIGRTVHTLSKMDTGTPAADVDRGTVLYTM